MSRIGKNPVVIPDKVTVKVVGSVVSVQGPLGQLNFTFSDRVAIQQDNKQLVVNALDNSKYARALWGTTRAVINNMVHGVSQGFVKVLEINGVGYKVIASGQKLTFSLGYSHPIDYDLPSEIKAKVQGNKLELSSFDKELLGLVAAKIRSLRPPEPYKGKGIKYMNEHIIRKAGKTGAKA